MKRNNLIGKHFEKLEVIGYAGKDMRGNTLWLCECECGNSKVIRGSKLKSGEVKSCGCARHAFSKERCEHISASKIKHGLSGNRLYYVYDNMMKRCYNEDSDRYKNYGARGIRVCDEWREDRQAFFEWALNNGYRDGLTIDRIDVNGNYCPENCRWATQQEQANNRTSNHNLTFNGETHTIAEWAAITSLSPNTIYKRISDGWDTEHALTTPVR